jgi:cysteine synthase A
MKAKNILETIGNTPHVKINNLFYNHNIDVWLKIEKSNPGGSIKDRIAVAMIEEAETNGELKKGMTIVEPTSGNTGIGLAMAAAVKGYKIIIIMPESVSVERRKVLTAYGAEVKLTKAKERIKGAIALAEKLKSENSKIWIAGQFTNKTNSKIHSQTTALEILQDFPEGIDYLISGVGTGGHLSGTAETLKKKFPNLKVYAVEPAESSVIAGGKASQHFIQGIGPGFIPDNLNVKILDGTISVTKEEAYSFTKLLAKKEGIFSGISTGATLAAISKKIDKINKGATVLCFNCDGGEKYLSVEGLF